MSETLYDIARANLRGATRLFQLLGDDPRDLNLCGYHIQQAAEFGLKFVLEEQSIDYPETHSISTLMSAVDSVSSSFIFGAELQEELELFSGTLTVWESQTRYIKDWFVDLKSVCRGYRMAAALLEAVAVWSGSEQEKFTLPVSVGIKLKATRIPVQDMNLGGGDG